MNSLKLPTLLVAFAIMGTQYAEAQGCNTSVAGNYSYSSIGDGIAGSLFTNTTSTGTGTTTGSGTGTGPGTTTSNYSNTSVGNLLSGLSGTNPFATAGSWYFSSGTVFASSATDLSAQRQIGTYTLNSDCTISVTLNDVFSTATSPQPARTLQGLVLNGGNQIILGLLQNAPTTTGTGTSTGTGTTQTFPTNGLLQTSTLIELTRSASPSSCSTSSLTGRYGLVATGMGVASSTVTSFFVFGTLQFDGNGHIVAPSSPATSSTTSSPSTSPLSYLQFAGTYTVNPDCTGTMTISIPTTSTSGTTMGTGTGTGTTPSTQLYSTTTLNFVLTAPEAVVSPSGVAFTAGQAKPMIDFSGVSGSQTLEGYAEQF